MKFCLANAFSIGEVWGQVKGKRDLQVVGFRACFNPLYESKIKEAAKNYTDLTKQAKDLGKYLATYRDISPNVFKDNYYVSQITILEGLKARAKQTTSFLKKLKKIKTFGTGQAERIAQSMSNTEQLESYNQKLHNGQPNYAYESANQEFKKRLSNIDNALLKECFKTN